MSDPVMGRDYTVEVIMAPATGTPTNGAYAPPSTGWLPLGGTRGLSLSSEWDTVDTTSRSSAGNVRSNTATYLAVSGSIDGVYIPETAENIVALQAYVENPAGGQPNGWLRLTRPNPAVPGGTITKTLYVMFSNFNMEMPYDEATTFSFDYAGKQPVITATVAP
jgi:predicted secreted protein